MIDFRSIYLASLNKAKNAPDLRRKLLSSIMIRKAKAAVDAKKEIERFQTGLNQKILPSSQQTRTRRGHYVVTKKRTYFWISSSNDTLEWNSEVGRENYYAKKRKTA